MHLKKIQLVNFRNFPQKTLEFSPQTTVIVGSNASGKTNMLEAIYVLSTGKSFRAKVEGEMIGYTADYCRVESQVGEINLAVVLTRAMFQKKRLVVNGLGKRGFDFAGVLKTTLFGPWDLDLITAAPSLRRKFLDAVMSQVDREYRRAILSYDKGLRQRNRLLYRIREEHLSKSQLAYWNDLLIKNGSYITSSRENLIKYINSFQSPISPTSPRLRGTGNLKLIYKSSQISESRLVQYAREEVAAAMTLVGPHRDDFQVNDDKRDLATFGSRGEQRMGVLWLKLAELAFVEEKTGDRPILLLDDIFSELDSEHRQVVMGIVKNQQTIITTADPHYIELKKDIAVIKL